MRISASFVTAFLLTLGLIACGGSADEGTTEDMADDTMAMAGEPADGMGGEMSGGALSTPSWMTMDESAKTVSLAIRAGDTEANNRWNFNGLYAGEGAIVVPEGYSVTVNFTNADPNQPHSIGIDEAMESYPATFASPEPAFAGAISPDAGTTGTAPNGTATLTFTANRAGEYVMICYIAGHAVAGMHVPFEVSADGSAGVRQ